MSAFLLKLLAAVGGFCFAYCGVPAAWATVKAGKSIGTPVSVAWSICIGALCMYTYLLLSYGFDWILAVNYGVEFTSWATIVVYHYKGRRIQ